MTPMAITITMMIEDTNDDDNDGNYDYKDDDDDDDDNDDGIEDNNLRKTRIMMMIVIMMSMMIMRLMTMIESRVKMMTKAFTISNGKRTKWSKIQGVIGRVISIWRYEITSPITPKLYNTGSYYRLIVSMTK